jgi:hypothetical protein
VHDITDLEMRGLPGLFVASSEFVEAAASQAAALGFEPSAIFVPHPIQDRTNAEMRVIADDVLHDLLNALTS